MKSEDASCFPRQLRIGAERGQRTQATAGGASGGGSDGLSVYFNFPDRLFQDEIGDQPVQMLLQQRNDENQDTERHLKQE